MLTEQQKGTLHSLCEEYVWYMLICANGGGEIADRRRRECHIAIISLLDLVDWHIDTGFFHRLDEMGFPTDYEKLTDVEGWERIARTVGRKAYKRLREALDLGRGQNE